ncbi:MAG: Gfo/Idh/MocA family oxidoreductase [Erysipelothrix sp.]|nr:Gfo/Idh/MocA family oxidoreductase [Erysipelothrix sp.]
MKFGFVGTNFVSEFMLEASNLVDGFELAAVCSRSLENAKAFAKKHNVEYYTDDYKDFLNQDIDAVYLAVPNVLHKDIAIFFLENKIPVFCEKPMASNVDEVKAMIAASRANDTLLAEAIVPVYTQAFKVIKDNLERIGNVRRAVISMGQYSSRYDAYRKGTILNAFKPELSNGSIMDIGIYPLSLAMGLFGKPKSVFANAYLLSSKVDGLGTMILNYSDKEVIIMHSKIVDQLLLSEIQGEDGTIQFDHASIPKKVVLIPRNGEPEVLFEDDQNSLMYYELTAFMDAFKKGLVEVPEVTHQMILDVHTVLTEARRQTGVIFPADL